jgi:hypothetical protein
MKTTIKILIHLIIITFIVSCNSATNANQNKEVKTTETTSTEQTEIKGDYCFLKAENRDTTLVKIRILSSDDVRGEMMWLPWEKDGAVGSLTGKLNSNNELELIYDYVIEGSSQTEVKIMKIENQKLYIKVGELEDKKNDGNLTYKDASKAEYKEVMDKMECK